MGQRISTNRKTDESATDSATTTNDSAATKELDITTETAKTSESAAKTVFETATTSASITELENTTESVRTTGSITTTELASATVKTTSCSPLATTTTTTTTTCCSRTTTSSREVSATKKTTFATSTTSITVTTPTAYIDSTQQLPTMPVTTTIKLTSDKPRNPQVIDNNNDNNTDNHIDRIIIDNDISKTPVFRSTPETSTTIDADTSCDVIPVSSGDVISPSLAIGSLRTIADSTSDSELKPASAETESFSPPVPVSSPFLDDDYELYDQIGLPAHNPPIQSSSSGVTWFQIDPNSFKSVSDLLECGYGLLVQLLSKGVLTERQVADIKAETSPFKQNDKLLELMTQQFLLKEEMKVAFISSLCQTGQGHLACCFTTDVFNSPGDNRPLSDAERRDIVFKSAFLVDNLDVDHGLLDRLLASGVITAHHQMSIREGTSPYRRNEELINIIKRRSRAQYNEFLKCLCWSGQQHIADVLNSNGAVLAVDAAFRSSGTHFVSELQAEIVKFYRKLRTSRERQRVLLELLGFSDAELVGVTDGHSIRLYFLCHSLVQLRSLRYLATEGLLKFKIEALLEVFRSSRSALIQLQHVYLINYCQCEEYFYRQAIVEQPEEEPVAVKDEDQDADLVVMQGEDQDADLGYVVAIQNKESLSTAPDHEDKQGDGQDADLGYVVAIQNKESLSTASDSEDICSCTTNTTRELSQTTVHITDSDYSQSVSLELDTNSDSDYSQPVSLDLDTNSDSLTGSGFQSITSAVFEYYHPVTPYIDTHSDLLMNTGFQSTISVTDESQSTIPVTVESQSTIHVTVESQSTIPVIAEKQSTITAGTDGFAVTSAENSPLPIIPAAIEHSQFTTHGISEVTDTSSAVPAQLSTLPDDVLHQVLLKSFATLHAKVSRTSFHPERIVYESLTSVCNTWRMIATRREWHFQPKLKQLLANTGSIRMKHIRKTYIYGTYVHGVAELKPKLYVVCDGNKLTVLNSTSLTVLRQIVLKVDGYLKLRIDNIVASSITNMIYLWDHSSERVWSLRHVSRNGDDKYELKLTTGIKQGCQSISVTSQGDLLVLLDRPARIFVYRATSASEPYDMTVTDTIHLSSSICNPRHGAKTSSGYVISHSLLSDGSRTWISEVNHDGHVIRSYGGLQGTGGEGALCYGAPLANDNDGDVFVADFYNNRLLVLDSTLRLLKVLRCDNDDDDNDRSFGGSNDLVRCRPCLLSYSFESGRLLLGLMTSRGPGVAEGSSGLGELSGSDRRQAALRVYKISLFF